MIFKDNVFLNQLETLKQIPGFTYQEIIAEINFLLVKNSTGSLTYNPERQKYVYNP